MPLPRQSDFSCTGVPNRAERSSAVPVLPYARAPLLRVARSEDLPQCAAVKPGMQEPGVEGGIELNGVVLAMSLIRQANEAGIGEVFERLETDVPWRLGRAQYLIRSAGGVRGNVDQNRAMNRGRS